MLPGIDAIRPPIARSGSGAERGERLRLSAGELELAERAGDLEDVADGWGGGDEDQRAAPGAEGLAALEQCAEPGAVDVLQALEVDDGARLRPRCPGPELGLDGGRFLQVQLAGQAEDRDTVLNRLVQCNGAPRTVMSSPGSR